MVEGTRATRPSTRGRVATPAPASVERAADGAVPLGALPGGQVGRLAARRALLPTLLPALQRAVGNRAVQELLSVARPHPADPAALQRKVSISYDRMRPATVDTRIAKVKYERLTLPPTGRVDTSADPSDLAKRHVIPFKLIADAVAAQYEGRTVQAIYNLLKGQAEATSMPTGELAAFPALLNAAIEGKAKKKEVKRNASFKKRRRQSQSNMTPEPKATEISDTSQINYWSGSQEENLARESFAKSLEGQARDSLATLLEATLLGSARIQIEAKNPKILAWETKKNRLLTLAFAERFDPFPDSSLEELKAQALDYAYLANKVAQARRAVADTKEAFNRFVASALTNGGALVPWTAEMVLESDDNRAIFKAAEQLAAPAKGKMTINAMHLPAAAAAPPARPPEAPAVAPIQRRVAISYSKSSLVDEQARILRIKYERLALPKTTRTELALGKGRKARRHVIPFALMVEAVASKYEGRTAQSVYNQISKNPPDQAMPLAALTTFPDSLEAHLEGAAKKKEIKRNQARARRLEQSRDPKKRAFGKAQRPKATQMGETDLLNYWLGSRTGNLARETGARKKRGEVRRTFKALQEANLGLDPATMFSDATFRDPALAWEQAKNRLLVEAYASQFDPFPGASHAELTLQADDYARLSNKVAGNRWEDAPIGERLTGFLTGGGVRLPWQPAMVWELDANKSILDAAAVVRQQKARQKAAASVADKKREIGQKIDEAGFKLKGRSLPDTLAKGSLPKWEAAKNSLVYDLFAAGFEAPLDQADPAAFIRAAKAYVQQANDGADAQWGLHKPEEAIAAFPTTDGARVAWRLSGLSDGGRVVLGHKGLLGVYSVDNQLKNLFAARGARAQAAADWEGEMGESAVRDSLRAFLAVNADLTPATMFAAGPKQALAQGWEQTKNEQLKRAFADRHATIATDDWDEFLGECGAIVTEAERRSRRAWASQSAAQRLTSCITQNGARQPWKTGMLLKNPTVKALYQRLKPVITSAPQSGSGGGGQKRRRSSGAGGGGQGSQTPRAAQPVKKRKTKPNQ